jgi:ribonuclease HI
MNVYAVDLKHNEQRYKSEWSGGILIIPNSKHISSKCGLGAATNNFAELKAASILMNLEREEGMRSLNIYGDSKLVIEWMQGF